MTAAPIDGDLCLVRDLRYPSEGPELARFRAGHRPEYAEWEFFGTDDSAPAEDVEVVAHMVAVRTNDVDRSCCDGDFVIYTRGDEDEFNRIDARSRRY